MEAKSVMGFLADVLYIKGLICFEEYEDIMEIRNDRDIDRIVERMLCDEYNVYKRGEAYVGYKREGTDDLQVRAEATANDSSLHDRTVPNQTDSRAT